MGKRSPDQSSAPKTLSFDEKTVKMGPADLEKIISEKLFKKQKIKKKEINASKTYNPVGNLAKRAK